MPFSKPFTYLLPSSIKRSPEKTKSHLAVKLPGKGTPPPPPFPLPCHPPSPTEPLYGERNTPFLEPIVYSFIHVSSESQVTEFAQETGGTHTVTIQGAPRWILGLHTMRCGQVPQADRFDIAITTLVPYSHRHISSHLDVGRPEPC